MARGGPPGEGAPGSLEGHAQVTRQPSSPAFPSSALLFSDEAGATRIFICRLHTCGSISLRSFLRGWRSFFPLTPEWLDE